MNLERKDIQPFYKPIGGRVGGDLHGQVNTLDSNYLVKTLRFPWRTIGNWRGKLKENSRDDYLMLKKYLGPFIPPTYMVEGIDRNGQEGLMFVQKRINARPLREVEMDELKKESIVKQFADFTQRVSKMYRETGRTPDLHGSNKDQYNLKLTKNIMLDDEGGIWFVDIDLVGPFWSLTNPFSKNHMRKIMQSLNDFTERLIRESEVIKNIVPQMA